MRSDDFCIVYITTASKAEAESIAETLVTERLAACCSIIPAVSSIYWWQGSLQREEEWMLMCKSSRNAFAALEKRTREIHSYDVPEIIMLPLAEGSKPYLQWIAETLKSKTWLK